MSKKHANKKNRSTTSSQKDSERMGSSKGRQTQSREVEDEQIGNFDIAPSKGYQASGRQQHQDVEDDQVGNRSQGSERSFQGAGRNRDELHGRLASAKDHWTNDQDMGGTDRQNQTNRTSNASIKTTAQRDTRRSKEHRGSKQ